MASAAPFYLTNVLDPVNYTNIGVVTQLPVFVPNIFTPSPAPATSYGDAAAQATARVLCVATPFLAGLALRTPQTALFAIPMLLFAALQCGTDPASVPQRPFAGGQCATVYNGLITVANADGSTFTQTVLLLGPLSWVNEVLPSGTRIQGLAGSDGNRTVVPLGTGQNIVNVQISRRDGGPDNCGDTQSWLPSPPPNPGPGPYPPLLPPGHPGPIYIPVQPPGGPLIQVPITIGPIVIAPEFSWPINISIDGYPWRLLPDGDLSPAPPDGDRPPSEDNGYTPELAARLEELYEEVFRPRTITLDRRTCDIPTLAPLVLSGSGLGVIPAGIEGLRTLQVERELQLCPAPPAQADRQLISGFMATATTTEFSTPALSEAVVSIEVIVTGHNPDLIPDAGPFPGAAQRRYGVANFCRARQGSGGDPVYLYDAVTYMRLPLPRTPMRTAVRLLLRPSVAVQVWDTGERV